MFHQLSGLERLNLLSVADLPTANLVNISQGLSNLQHLKVNPHLLQNVVQMNSCLVHDPHLQTYSNLKLPHLSVEVSYAGNAESGNFKTSHKKL